MNRFQNVLALLLFGSPTTSTYGQTPTAPVYSLRVEYLSQYVDVSGLFGANIHSANVGFSYQHRHLFADVSHAFSLEGNVAPVNTSVGLGYQTRLDRAGRWNLRVRGDVFYNGPLNLGFVRPVVSVNWQPNPNNQLSLIGFAFYDVRSRLPEQSTRVWGDAQVLSYAHTFNLPHHWNLRTEGRVAYGFIHEVRRSADVLGIIRLHYNPLRLYATGTLGRVFYNAPGTTRDVVALAVGKTL